MKGLLHSFEISTNLRTNLGDKGVTTEVRQAMPTNQIGWMGVPTCWQYKATEFRNILLLTSL